MSIKNCTFRVSSSSNRRSNNTVIIKECVIPKKLCLEELEVEKLYVKKLSGNPDTVGANVIYNNNGVLAFKGEDGTITVLANK